MYNYTITRLPYFPVFCILFAAGTLVGGTCGIIIGLLDRTSVGFMGGSFIGLMFGLVTSIIGLIYTAVFNLVAQYIGGLPVKVEKLPEENCTETHSGQPAQPDTRTQDQADSST